MKRFLVFAYSLYYPMGGSNDVAGSFDTLEEAQAEARSSHHDTCDILDLDERKWVG